MLGYNTSRGSSYAVSASSTGSTGPQVQKRFMSPYAIQCQICAIEAQELMLTIIQAGDARPEFLLLQPAQRIRRLFPSIWAVPFPDEKILLTMWGHLQHVHLSVNLAVFDILDFFPNRYERIDESIQFRFALRFCRLNHQSIGDRPTHSRSMEAIVLKALCNINCFDTSCLLKGTSVQDELMSTPRVDVGIEYRIMRPKTRHDIVGIE